VEIDELVELLRIDGRSVYVLWLPTDVIGDKSHVPTHHYLLLHLLGVDLFKPEASANFFFHVIYSYFLGSLLRGSIVDFFLLLFIPTSEVFLLVFFQDRFVVLLLTIPIVPAFSLRLLISPGLLSILLLGYLAGALGDWHFTIQRRL